MVRFILQVRCVDGRLNRQVQSFLFYICHNPDDLTKARGTSCVPTCSDIVHADLLADWILSRPVGFRQCLIQDHDGRRARIIAHRKEAPIKETGTNRFEEFRTDPKISVAEGAYTPGIHFPNAAALTPGSSAVCSTN